MNENNMIKTTNYGVFENIIHGVPIVIHTNSITKENWNDYYTGLLNLFKDFLEEINLHATMIKFIFDDGSDIDLTTEDTLINICMWGFIINTNQTIQPYHVFFEEDGITKKNIKKYIDNFCIIPNRTGEVVNFFQLNNTIYTALRKLSFVDKFAMYFNNSINLEDFIDMAIHCEEFNSILHKDYTIYPPSEMNNEAQKDTDRLIELILDSKRIMGREHCLIDAFRAKEGIKPKQLREVMVNIGVKPDGLGSIFSYSIDTSYVNGGLNTIPAMLADSKNGRLAQIITKKNTALSGTVARILGLNNANSKLYSNEYTSEPDPTYDCHTRNLIPVTIDSKIKLNMFADRFYRFQENGIEYNTGCGDYLDQSLIGKTIYLRSPITCASSSKGLGICRKCYGNLFYVNKYINIGKEASERITEKLSQKMLSAKHILEATVYIASWNNLDFDINDYFDIKDDTIYINSNIPNADKYSISIKVDAINNETFIDLNDGDDDHNNEYEINKEYVSSFYLITPDNVAIEIHTDKYDNLFITSEFSNLIQSKDYINDDDTIVVPLNVLIDNEINMFEIGIYNDDMLNKLKNIMNTIDLKAITESFNKETFLETLVNNMIEIGLGDISAVHPELIIMNQIRKGGDDILESPDWDIPHNNNYQVITLKKALETNPSVTISLQFNNIAKQLYNPLTFKKTKPSVMDLFYNVQPQVYMKSKPVEDTRLNAFEPYNKKDNK